MAWVRLQALVLLIRGWTRRSAFLCWAEPHAADIVSRFLAAIVAGAAPPEDSYAYQWRARGQRSHPRRGRGFQSRLAPGRSGCPALLAEGRPSGDREAGQPDMPSNDNVLSVVRRKMILTELADRVGIPLAYLSVLTRT